MITVKPDRALSQKWRRLIARMTDEQRMIFLNSLSDEHLRMLAYDWALWARDQQWPPPRHWRVWLMVAGRGFGKTRAGAEWVRMKA